MDEGRYNARGAVPRERLAALVAQDLTVRAIAAEVDRSPTTVRYWLQRYGLRTSAVARRAATTRAKTRQAPGLCALHGETPHVVRADGHVTCVRCRADAVTRWRRRAKATLVAEAGGSCRCCGYDRCIAALHFHHLDPETKRFGLGGRGLARSMETLRAEAAKCVLVCSNCHWELEAGVRTLSS